MNNHRIGKVLFATWIFSIAVIAIAACSGKGNVTQADIEQQAFDDLGSAVSEAIDDPAREKEALALVDGIQQDFLLFRESVIHRKTELRRLNSDYAATREEFSALINKYDAEIIRNHKKVNAKHQNLVAVTTPAEWDKIAKTDTKVMSQLAASLQSF